MNKLRKIKGYELIKEYPGSKKLGYFEKYTTGEFSNYPLYWKPVYSNIECILTIQVNKYIILNEKNLPVSKIIDNESDSINEMDRLAKLYSNNIFKHCKVISELKYIK